LTGKWFGYFALIHYFLTLVLIFLVKLYNTAKLVMTNFYRSTLARFRAISCFSWLHIAIKCRLAANSFNYGRNCKQLKNTEFAQILSRVWPYIWLIVPNYKGI